jgi:hypothetical protein
MWVSPGNPFTPALELHGRPPVLHVLPPPACRWGVASQLVRSARGPSLGDLCLAT